MGEQSVLRLSAADTLLEDDTQRRVLFRVMSVGSRSRCNFGQRRP